LNRKLFPLPAAYYFLSVLCLAAPAGQKLFPSMVFPAFAPPVVSLAGMVSALGFALRGLTLGRAMFRKRREARSLVRKALQERNPSGYLTGPAADGAGRTLSRVLRNADEDLREINPDFSLESLFRLVGLLPLLLDEIRNEKEAKIRLGVVGAYLGETAGRLWGWQWKFQSDPALRQFEFLASVLEQGEDRVDPFELAGELFEGNLKPRVLVEKLDPKKRS
jgi:hypothetical protein